MGRLLLMLMCLATGLLLWLTGCSNASDGFANGVPEPRPPVGVQITSISCLPGNLMFVDELAVFTVILSEPVDVKAAKVSIRIGTEDNPAYWSSGTPSHPVTYGVTLHASGHTPDATLGDDTWTGKIDWSARHVPLYGVPVVATLEWRYGGPGAELSGGTITVLSREEEE